MSAKLFFLPYQTATVAGIAAPGATLTFYNTGTTTKLPIYTTDALSVERTNPVTANGAGKFADIYLDSTKTYRLIIKDRAGATLDDIDPYIPGTAPDAGSLQPYADAAESSAVAASASADAASTSETNAATSAASAGASATAAGASASSASSSASAAEDAADVAQGVVTLPSAGAKSARWSGALGDGSTDDHPALQTWLDQGGYLYLPDGEYYSSDNLILRKPSIIQGPRYGIFSNVSGGDYTDYPGAKIRFAEGKGFIVQPWAAETDVATVVADPATYRVQEGALNSYISHIALIGAGTGATVTGFYTRTQVHLENVHVIGFTGKGFDFSASADVPDGNSEYGSCDLSTLKYCQAISNGSHGFHFRGRECNVLHLDTCNASSNGGWGFLNEAIYQSLHSVCHAANNTLGSYKSTSQVANHVYNDCYVEGDSGQTCHLGSYTEGSNIVIGGNLAIAARTDNECTNLPTIVEPHQVSSGYFLTSPEDALGATLAAGHAAFHGHPDYGGVLQGNGTGGTYDVSLINKSGTVAAGVLTGTTTFRATGRVQTNSDLLINGNVGWGGIIASQANMICHINDGLMLGGYANNYDTSLVNRNGAKALGVVANTINLQAFGNLAVTGTASASNLSGTNTGDQTSIVGITGTIAQFNTAVTDANLVPDARTITTTAPLTGGGDLSANRTLAISAATTAAAGSMSAEDKTRLDANPTFYRTIIDASGFLTAADAAATYGLPQGQKCAVSGTGTQYPLNARYLAAADFPAMGTLNPKLRIRVMIYCNDVAPGVTFTVGLHPITRPATSGGAGLCIFTIGAAVASSTVAIATPAADSSNVAVTAADFSMPADGHYVIGVVTSGGALAASAHVHISAVLQIRYA